MNLKHVQGRLGRTFQVPGGSGSLGDWDGYAAEYCRLEAENIEGTKTSRSLRPGKAVRGGGQCSIKCTSKYSTVQFCSHAIINA